MTAACVWLFVSSLQPPSAVSGTAASQTFPLVVERVEFVPSGTVPDGRWGTEVTLFNAGPRTIHAYGFRTVLTLPDGKLAQGGQSTDAYETRERHSHPGYEDECSGPLAARRRCRASSTPRAAIDPVSAKAFVSFMIFEDDTAVGDEREIEFYFRHRALNHRAWPVIEGILNEALAASSDPLMVLFEFRERLARVADGEVKLSRAYQEMDRHLAINMKIPRDDQGPFLRSIVEMVKTRRADAERHHQRR